MAIRDVVTRGFGNGTYDPGVNALPVRGFTILEVNLHDFVRLEDAAVATAYMDQGSMVTGYMTDGTITR